MYNLSQRVIKGYELKEQIGSGGFGAVYRAYQPDIGREVAIKVILPQHASQPDFIRRFETEAQLIARLEHPHIVPLYDYWRGPEGAFLVMRWLKSSLGAAMRHGPWSLEAAARLLDQMAGALTIAHRENVIHRDIKPDNILLDEDENAYLADFGIAKDLSLKEIKEEETLLGSPAYWTPEQIKGEAVTPQTDIYSLGLVVYELIVGERPFSHATTPAELIHKHLHEPVPPVTLYRSNLPTALNEVVQTATAKDPTSRYSTAQRFAAAFRAVTPIVQKASSQPLAEPLTGREFSILSLMVSGLNNEDIAQKLYLTVGTVRWYVKQIYSKLDVHSRRQAIERAQRLNLLDPKAPSSPSGVEAPLSVDSAVMVKQLAHHMLAPEPSNPYKGLRAFQESDADDFFGRASLVERLLTRLTEGGSETRFLAVVGPSGSGKSSIVKAGLIPALRQGAVPGSAGWFITEMLPGSHPLEELEAALLRVAISPVRGLLEQLGEDRRGLVRAAKRMLPGDSDIELLLVIDQFEELFTLVADEKIRGHFIDNLLSAVTDPRSRIRIVLTLRADFYDRPLLYPRLADLMRSHAEIIIPLTPTELERAILGPAERANLGAEQGLVTTIVNEVAQQPGALPLLQYALTELYERREGLTLTLNAYHAIDGILGALARRADELYERQDRHGQAAIRQLFLRLITLGEGSEDTRRRTLLSELTSVIGDRRVMEEVIDMFTAYRLLTLDHDPITRGPTVEVAHEALIREWARLLTWLNESRESIRLQQRLTEAVNEWEQAGRDPRFLAFGIRLEQFATLSTLADLPLTRDEQNYLETSIAKREQQKVAEEERQSREKILEYRSRKFLRILVVVLLAATLGAFGLTVFAVNKSWLAEQNAKLADRNASEAQSLALASAAQLALSTGNSDQAVTLAIAANRIDRPPALAQRILYDTALAPGTRLILHEYAYPVVFSPDGRTSMFQAGPTYSTVVLWDTETGQQIRRFDGHKGEVFGLAYSPDGSKILTGSADKTVILWDITTGQIIRRFDAPSFVSAVAFSPDGQRVAAGLAEPGITIVWNAQTGKELRRFEGAANPVSSVAFSPDGQSVVSGFGDPADPKAGKNLVLLWNIESGNVIRRFDVSAGVSDVGFTPDTRHILATLGNPDNVLMLWEIETGALVHRFEGHSGAVLDAAITPDGRYILSGSQDTSLILWDMGTGKLLQRFQGHTRLVFSVAICPSEARAI